MFYLMILSFKYYTLIFLGSCDNGKFGIVEGPLSIHPMRVI